VRILGRNAVHEESEDAGILRVSEVRLSSPHAFAPSGRFTNCDLMEAGFPMTYGEAIEYDIDMNKAETQKIDDLSRDVKALRSELASSKPIVVPENWLKRHSYWFWPSLAAALVFIGWISGATAHVFGLEVDSRIDTKQKEVLVALEKLQTKATQAETNIEWLMKRALAATIENKNNTPQEIQDAAVLALQQKIKVTPETIATDSPKLVNNPSEAAWRATLALANLRSQVNATIPDAEAFRFAHVFTGTNDPDVYDQKIGDFIAVVNETVILDPSVPEIRNGHYFLKDPIDRIPRRQYEDVVFRHCKILYGGGQIVLKNVFFEDCTFEVTPNNHGKNFAQKVLDSATITLTLS
jgi:hypothetical protein